LFRLCQLCEDIFGQKISEDTVIKFRKACHEHLERFEEHLKKQLSKSPVLHADETGIKVRTKTEWLHVLSSAELTYCESLIFSSMSKTINGQGELRNYCAKHSMSQR